MYTIYLDDNSYAIHIDYLNVTNSRSPHTIILPGKNQLNFFYP